MASVNLHRDAMKREPSRTAVIENAGYAIDDSA